ncbi:MAG: glycosyl transferase family 1 [Halobacteriales archaeon SW_9_67_25]|nr:MAG: glycosyl transferase family 1 [Halobacteriales archaeon SW_9_67_25]
MRVALVAMETTNHRNTAGNHRFERLARQLVGAGHDVRFFCARWWSSDPDTVELDGVEYHGIADDDALAEFCLRLPVAIFQYAPDVVHTRPAPPPQVIAASTGGTLARAPLALEWFGDEGLDPNAPATRVVAREPQMVLTPSELVRTRVRELGALGRGSRTIAEGIDFDAVGQAGVGEGVDVAYAHPLDESANAGSLLLGLAELRDKDWQATVIGDGPRRGDYERQAADLRIDDRVTFAGACDRDRRLRVYRGAHVFVQTAYREYFPTELLWALACGCVGLVEYQAESSAHELIENYERSFGVTDPGGIADAIVEAGQFDRRDTDDTWQSYDHGAVLDRYVDTYEKLLTDFSFV